MDDTLLVITQTHTKAKAFQAQGVHAIGAGLMLPQETYARAVVVGCKFDAQMMAWFDQEVRPCVAGSIDYF